MKKILETERLFLRKLTENDFDALYKVLADSDIMQHYPYTFDESRVRNWINKRYQRQGYAKEAARACREWAFDNTPFNILYSYMKKTNVASVATAMANGMSKVDEYTDEENEIMVVYAIRKGDKNVG